MIRPVAILLAAGLAACQPAHAQGSNCAPHSTVVERLAEGYGERVQNRGLADAETVVETFANPVTGTWTIVVSGMDGTACLVASGEGWHIVTSPEGDPA